MARARDDGYTIIELLVAISIFAVISAAFYQLMFSATRGSNAARDTVRVSEEARLALNRLIREAREADSVDFPTATSFRVQNDFDGDGVIEPTPSDAAGSYESLTFTANIGAAGGGTLVISSGTDSEVLMSGLDCVRDGAGDCYPIFTYTSSRLEYDANSDGVTSAAELDQAASVGNNNGILDGAEVGLIDTVSISLVVTQGGAEETFYAQAQLRNQR